MLALTLINHLASGRQDSYAALARADQEQKRFEEDLQLMEDNETQTLEELQTLRTLMSTPLPTEPASITILRELLTSIETLTNHWWQARQDGVELRWLTPGAE